MKFHVIHHSPTDTYEIVQQEGLCHTAINYTLVRGLKCVAISAGLDYAHLFGNQESIEIWHGSKQIDTT